jgi:hypothetical protein
MSQWPATSGGNLQDSTSSTYGPRDHELSHHPHSENSLSSLKEPIHLNDLARHQLTWKNLKMDSQ